MYSCWNICAEHDGTSWDCWGGGGREGGEGTGWGQSPNEGQGQAGAPRGCPRGCPCILGISAKTPDVFGVTSEGQGPSDPPLTQLRVVKSIKALEAHTFAQEICHFKRFVVLFWVFLQYLKKNKQGREDPKTCRIGARQVGLAKPSCTGEDSWTCWHG